jgi:hypothetical protein
MADNEVVSGVEIDARRQRIEVRTLVRGKGRQNRYTTLSAAPQELRGEALLLIRTALRNAGYESLTELEEALTSDLVVPEKDEADEEEG